MKQERNKSMLKFHELLNNRSIEFNYDAATGKTEITEKGNVIIFDLTTLPAGVVFNNNGYIYLHNLTTLPEVVIFNNNGYIDLRSLTTLPEGIIFNNKGEIYLRDFTTLPAGVTADITEISI